jgi:serine/threonine-protein kinase
MAELAPDENPPTLDHRPAAEAGAPAPDSLPAVPGYEVECELGRGGMGVVYRAQQTALARTVALKVILAGAHAGTSDRARFRKEAEAVAGLQHPNIVQVHEVGEHDGRLFFSLEHCAGGSLEKRLDGTPLPPAEAARLVEALARAVHYAHGQGVIHRDLKPGNVLFTADGALKLTDFGLVKRLGETGRTATGAILGTPSYMAPEQAEGKGRPVGPAADVYGLGAILYELLTGRPPFKAATPVDTILQVVADEPVPPSRLHSRTPRDLETVCLKCLRKGPHQRYPSAAALADDLGRWLRGEPVLARRAGAAERTWRWCRRHPAPAALVLLAALLLLSVTAGAVLVARTAAAGRARIQVIADRVEEQVRRRQAEVEEARAALLLAEEGVRQSEAELAGWRRSSPLRPDQHGRLRPPPGAAPAEVAEWDRKRAEFQAREAILDANCTVRRAQRKELQLRLREGEQRLEQFRALLPEGAGER